MSVISVVIPAFNDADLLASCLAALTLQTRPADEIIVVDNASTDATVEVARIAGARLVYEPLRGIWPAAAAGYDAADGDIIARLDADSVPPPEWLAQIEDTMRRRPEIAALTGLGVFYGPRNWVNWAGTHLYIGGLYWALTPYLGRPPLFGSNFAMRQSLWHDSRTLVHRTNAGIHDDLDFTFNLPAEANVVYDPTLVVGISSRPFDSWRAFGRRLGWTGTTLAANWPHAAPWRQRTAQRRLRETDAFSARTEQRHTP